MNKFWEWMEKNRHATGSNHYLITLTAQDSDNGEMLKSLTEPYEQMLIGYKIEYLEEKVGNISIRKYGNLWFIDEANTDTDELGKELAYANSPSKALEKAIEEVNNESE